MTATHRGGQRRQASRFKDLLISVEACVPAAFFGMGVFDDVAGQARRNLAASVNNEPDERQRISGE